jgi:hypothetical protein
MNKNNGNKNNFISNLEKTKAKFENGNGNNFIDIDNTNNTNNTRNTNNSENYILSFPQVIYRTKTYSVKYIKKWNEKNKIPIIEGIDNIDFQSNMIIDQIKILLDNMSFFKLHYLQGKDVK